VWIELEEWAEEKETVGAKSNRVKVILCPAAAVMSHGHSADPRPVLSVIMLAR